MLELIETSPAIDVQESEFRRLLGYPRSHEPDHRSRELAAATRAWFAEHGRPWFYLREVALELDDERFRLDGAGFELSQMHEQLMSSGAHTAFVAVVSGGAECENQARSLWEEGKPDEYFFLETYGSAVVEHLIALAAHRMCAWADAHGLVALPHYSPGYSGWDIADQDRLHDAIVGRGRTPLPGPLAVLDSGMLKPKKSLIAVFGITRHRDRVADTGRLIPCETCSLQSCEYRRAPYKHRFRQLTGTVNGAATPAFDRPPLTPQAKYSLNSRALAKWSTERLQLNTRDDGLVEAVFRYEGTTCSNMGRPLSYDYHITLGPATGGFPVRETRCVPSPDDDGHRSMCAYISDPDGFQRALAAEQPLLGQRLDDLLNWQRPVRPTGCYCDAESRAHKWGIVFEVIHYTLARSLAQATAERDSISKPEPVTNLT